MTTPFPWAMRMREQDGQTTLVGDKEQWEQFTATRPRVTAKEALFPELEGAAVFTRPCLARATLALEMRRQGVLTVAETDDNYFAPDRQNIVSRWNAAGRAGLRPAREGDGVDGAERVLDRLAARPLPARVPAALPRQGAAGAVRRP